MLSRRAVHLRLATSCAVSVSFALWSLGGCKEQEAPSPPSKQAARPSPPSHPAAQEVPPAPPPPPAKALDALPEESRLSGLTQLSFQARVDAPRFLPGALTPAKVDGIAFVDRGSKGATIVAVDLEGRPLELSLPAGANQEFAVDARGWIVGTSEQSGITTGARRLVSSGELRSFDPAGTSGAPLEGEGFQGFPDLDASGERVVYVSAQSGDPELWMRARRGGDTPTRLTRSRGMDARPRFTADGTGVMWSASRPQGKAQLDAWADFERDGSVPPLDSEIWTLEFESGQARRRTQLGAHSFAPAPFGSGIIFTSDAHDPKRQDFDLYYLGPEDEVPQRLTHAPGFDGLATPLPDGRIAFVSERAGGKAQLFVFKLEGGG